MNLSNYYKTLEAIKETAARKQQLLKLTDAERQTAREKYAAASHEERAKMNNEIVEREKKNDAIRANNTFIDVVLLALENNARCELLQAVAPVVVDVLKRYEGKQYGPKTKENIKAASGVALILDNWEARFIINGCCYCLEGNFLNDSNMILAPDSANITIQNTKQYIPDPEAYARDTLNAREKLRQFSEAYYKAVDEYNNIIVDGLPALNYPRTVYGGIFTRC